MRVEEVGARMRGGAEYNFWHTSTTTAIIFGVIESATCYNSPLPKAYRGIELET